MTPAVWLRIEPLLALSWLPRRGGRVVLDAARRSAARPRSLWSMDSLTIPLNTAASPMMSQMPIDLRKKLQFILGPHLG